MEKLKEMVACSIAINDNYSVLMTLNLNGYKNGTQYMDTISELYKYIMIERKLYDSLNNGEVDNYIKIINSIIKSSDYSDKDYNKYIYDRILEKLDERSKIVSENSSIVSVDNNLIGFDGKFLVEDFLECYVSIETYRLVWNRIITTDTFSKDEKLFKENLIKCYDISKINDFSAYTLIELFGLVCSFNIHELPKIDISFVLNCNDDLRGSILNFYYDCSVRALNELLEFTDNNNSLDDVFGSLLIMSEFETMLDILDDENLRNICSYFDDYYDEESSGIICNSVKKLIRKKEEGIN